MSIDHYENFPVASLLCPPDIRPAVLAIYRFARTADDIADEGSATADQRRADLDAYRADLDAVFADRAPTARWQPIFERLAAARDANTLPKAPLADLLDAFAQDTTNALHANRAGLLDYCRRSANPVGRLMLHLYGVRDAQSMRQSDAICTALQLINFWQDCSVDLPRGRVYLPLDEAQRNGIDLAAPHALVDTQATRALLGGLCDWARELMHEGLPLATRLQGRAGWELRIVVQAGLRMLDKIARMGHSTIRRRPALGAFDIAPIVWRSVTMRRAREIGP